MRLKYEPSSEPQVREAYWKVYNNLYIGSQDAMIPAFPLLDVLPSTQTPTPYRGSSLIRNSPPPPLGPP